MKNILFSITLIGFALLTTQCKNDDDEISAPHWIVEHNTNFLAPNWKVEQTDPDLSSSMTITATIGELYDSDIPNEDMMAIFCDDECLAVSHPTASFLGDKRFYLYVVRPKSEENKKLIAAYYNEKTQQIYYWDDDIVFENDNTIGNTDEPYMFFLAKSFNYPYTLYIVINIPDKAKENWSENDECAIFMNNKCLTIIDEYISYSSIDYVQNIALPSPNGTFEVKYYSAELNKIFSKTISYDINSQYVEVNL